MKRSRLLAAGVLLALSSAVGVHGPLRAEEASTVRASIECARVAEVGRVRCEVEARAVGGGVLRWADVEIVETPAFVAPLRGRIGARDATSSSAEAWHWALGLVARKAGSGEVRARVRVVECASAQEQRCTPHVVLVTGTLTVGS